MEAPDFWDDAKKSQQVIQNLKQLKSSIEGMKKLEEMYEGKKFPDVKALRETKRELLIRRKNISVTDQELGTSREQIRTLLSLQKESTGRDWKPILPEKKEKQIQK